MKPIRPALLLPLFVLLACSGYSQREYKPLPFSKVAVEAQPGLWFSSSEVAIGDYDLFLDWLHTQGREADVANFTPDDSVWLRDLAFNDPYATYYHHHEAFKPYPVVGVSLEAAQAYCDYLTATQGTQKLRTADGKTVEVRVKFRLPSPEEWMSAAGATQDSAARWKNTCYPGRIFYPRDHKGQFRFNHKLGDGDYAGYAGDKGLDFEGYMITAPVRSFPPDNHLGLHNLAGNVAEMTSEPGVAKGGSWAHRQDDCRTHVVNAYELPMAWLGFRVVAERVEVGNVGVE